MRPRSLSRKQVEEDVAAFQARFEIVPYDRPRTRGDCIDGPRPCPYALCKYHLGYEILKSGALFQRFADSALGVGAESCALDVADRGGTTLEEVAQLCGVTRERIRQIEEKALYHIRLNADRLEAPSEPEGLGIPGPP